MIYVKYNIQLHFIPLRRTTRAKQINHCKRHQLNVSKSTTPQVTRQVIQVLNSRTISSQIVQMSLKKVPTSTNWSSVLD